MSGRVIDFFSDTATVPTTEMRKAIMEATVGDDGRGLDPTANRLELIASEITGKEAALFLSSGTMGNLVAILTHCNRGDEIIVGESSHIFSSEDGGASSLGGISYRTLKEDRLGKLDLSELESALKPDGLHYSRTSMLSLENTHNDRGGVALTQDYTKEVAQIANKHCIPLHIDGARLFNASVCLGTPVDILVKDADSVSISLSKGLCAPVGAVLCGSKAFVEIARRHRKVLGGGMRQVGMVAAAGIVALETMVDRLADDHSNAKRLAVGLSRIDGISIDPDSVHTNLVYFDVCVNQPGKLAEKLEKNGVLGGSDQSRWRFVCYNGISQDDVDYTLDIIDSSIKGFAVN